MSHSKPLCYSLVLLTAFLMPIWCFCAGTGQAMATGSFPSLWDNPSERGAPSECDGNEESESSCPMTGDGGAPGNAVPCEAAGDATCECVRPSIASSSDDPAEVLPSHSSLPLSAVPAAVLPQSMSPHTLFEAPAAAAIAEQRVPEPQCAPSLFSQSCLLTL